MSEIALHFKDKRIAHCVIEDGTTAPVLIKFVDEKDNLLHLFTILSSDHYGEIDEIDTSARTPRLEDYLKATELRLD